VDSRGLAVAVLSVLPTPLLVLGSAHELYLRNQRELDGFVSVLRPFWMGAFATTAVGLVLTALRARRWARIGLWAYHAGGAAFLVYSVLRALAWGDHLAAWTLDRTATVVILLLVYLAAVAWLARHDSAVAMKPLAAFAVLLLAQEAWRMGSRLATVGAAEDVARPVPALAGTDPSLPNVYHLVLDAFQPDHFDEAWPKDAPLDGFVYFRAARSLFPATAPSMASLFTSRTDVKGPRFLQDALASPDSLPRRLRAAGYRSVAYLPPNIYPDPLEGFDGVVWHTVRLPPEQTGALHRWLFPRLWLAVTLPADLVDRLSRASLLGLPPDELRQMRSLKGSTLTQPITTLHSFERYLDQEASLPARGRYTLVHLLVPHNPFVLTAECAFSPARTDVMTQSRCAALLARRFLARLDGLGRLRDSIVLIHSDHGDWAGGPIDAGQPALFLLKRGRASGSMARRSEPVTLVDVTPTLLSVLGLPGSPAYQGRGLLDRETTGGREEEKP
jgi:hypothetical protein